MALERHSRAGIGLEAYEAVFEHAPDAMMFTVPDGRVLAANPAACDLLRMTEAEICERGRPGMVDSLDDRWLAALAQRERTGRVRAELPMRRGDGTWFIADLTSAIFATDDGETHACVVFRDVTDRVGLLERQTRLLEEMRQLALVDDLTSLRNRRGFFAVAAEHLAIGDREAVPTALLFLDLVGLKQLNDTLGHAAGDQALVALADAIRHATRPGDVAARMGGDEFVVLVHVWDGQVVPRVVARIRDEISDSAQAPKSLEVAVGIAIHEPGAPQDVDDLLALADRDMYDVKRSERARFSG